MKADYEYLGRTYFPSLDMTNFDIEVKKNHTFYINSDVVLANNVKISLAPKAQLIIDGAQVKKGNSTDLTEAIEIQEKKFLFFFKRKKGTVELRDNAKIIP